MCGISAYIGPKDPLLFVFTGMKKLAYRGYDSAGIALMLKNKTAFIKKVEGSPEKLISLCERTTMPTDSHIGVGHNRWATHGKPSVANAHPHGSLHEEILVVHNGIIENYDTLRKLLEPHGYHYKSETDTEVLANYIEFIRRSQKLSVEEAIRLALQTVSGAYALIIVSPLEPDTLFAIRNGSPLSVGKIPEGGFCIASDPIAYLGFTRESTDLEDGQMTIFKTTGEMTTKSITDNQLVNLKFETLANDLAKIEKDGYEHFMLKEIYEQPKSLENCLRGRIVNNTIKLTGVDYFKKHRTRGIFDRVFIVGCGTSLYSAMEGKYMLEELAHIQSVEFESAADFHARHGKRQELGPDDLVIVISQSGETADTLLAAQYARAQGAIVFGICNVVGSSISKLTHTGIYTHAGPEIGVASTKAFTAQVTALALFAIGMGAELNVLDRDKLAWYCEELEAMPQFIEEMMDEVDVQARSIASFLNRSYFGLENFVPEYFNKFLPRKFNNALFLGRTYGLPLAYEGALKLKEISYIHAEGGNASEIKHGPIALITRDMPVVVIATRGHLYEKILSNMSEIKSRGGTIISIVTEGDERARALSDFYIEIPDVSDIFLPIVGAIPLQLIAYYTAVGRGLDVDRPRNLAKSVTVQ